MKTKEGLAIEYSKEVAEEGTFAQMCAMLGYLAGLNKATQWISPEEDKPPKNTNVFVKYIIINDDVEVYHETYGYGCFDYKGEWWVEDRHLEDPDYKREIIGWRDIE